MAGFEFDDLFGGFDMFNDTKEDKKKSRKKEEVEEVAEIMETTDSDDADDSNADEVDLTEEAEGIEESDGAEEKEEKKASTSAKAKPSTKKRDVGATKLTCPVEVCLPAHKFTLEAAGGTFTPTLKQVVEELKDRYPETQVLVPVVSGNGVYFVFKSKKELSPTTLYDVESGVVKLAWGEKQGEYTAETFGGKPSVELSEVAKLIASTDDAYDDITYVGKDDVAVVVPFFKKCGLSADTLVEDGYTLVVYGSEYPVTAESADLKAFAKEKIGKLTDKQELIFRIDKVNKRVYTFAECTDAEVMSAPVNNGGKKKEVTKSYALPLGVWLYTFGDSYTLTSEDFDGKKFVTLEQVRKHFAKTIDAFADTSRSIDAVYNKDTNKLSLGFVSGKKG